MLLVAMLLVKKKRVKIGYKFKEIERDNKVVIDAVKAQIQPQWQIGHLNRNIKINFHRVEYKNVDRNLVRRVT